MTLANEQTHDDCPSSEIAAFIDGELSSPEQTQLEQHFAVCSVCRTELNQQKNFLFSLTASLESEKEFELPKNFTRTIVANAESRVSGLRRPKERFTAAFICSALFFFVLFALGGDAETIFRAAGSIAEKLFAVAAFAVSFIYHISLSSAVIARSFLSQTVVGLALSLSFLLILFAAALFVFSRFVYRGDRSTQEN